MITRELLNAGIEHRAEQPERHAEHAAGEAEDRRLDEELPADEARARADRLAHADLADRAR